MSKKELKADLRLFGTDRKKNDYDLDIIEVYFELLSRHHQNPDLVNNIYNLEHLEDDLKNYSAHYGIHEHVTFDENNWLIVNVNQPSYAKFLAWSLIYRSKGSIYRFLDHQFTGSKKFKEIPFESTFADLVEHRVLGLLKGLSKASYEDKEDYIWEWIRSVNPETDLEKAVRDRVMPDVMDIHEVAAFLKMSHLSVYRLTSKKLIPFSKPKGTKNLMFLKDEILNWIKLGGVKSSLELQKDFDKNAEEYLIKNYDKKR